jgi:hypothetical protein
LENKKPDWALKFAGGLKETDAESDSSDWDSDSDYSLKGIVVLPLYTFYSHLLVSVYVLSERTDTYCYYYTIVLSTIHLHQNPSTFERALPGLQ